MSLLDEASSSLRRMQAFDTTALPRRDELGVSFSFENAVEPAKRLVNLFRKLPAESLDEFPDQQLEVIKSNADQVFNLLDQISSFNPAEADAKNRKDQIIANIASQYQSVFSKIFPLISYSVARTVDFNRLEEQGRATVQSIEDKTAELVSAIEATSQKADEALKEVQAAAAEQGVSQQAHYFKLEAEREKREADTWRTTTYSWAAALALYGIVTLFLHKWDWLAPKTTSEAILFTTSKVIIFVTIAYLLVLSARNFLSHKHNEIVNRHRQNALQTFQALVNAGSTQQTQDIVLNHAASCIFAPQETGYVKQVGAAPQTSFVSDLVYKSMVRSDTVSG